MDTSNLKESQIYSMSIEELKDSIDTGEKRSKDLEARRKELIAERERIDKELEEIEREHSRLNDRKRSGWEVKGTLSILKERLESLAAVEKFQKTDHPPAISPDGKPLDNYSVTRVTKKRIYLSRVHRNTIKVCYINKSGVGGSYYGDEISYDLTYANYLRHKR